MRPPETGSGVTCPSAKPTRPVPQAEVLVNVCLPIEQTGEGRAAANPRSPIPAAQERGRHSLPRHRSHFRGNPTQLATVAPATNLPTLGACVSVSPPRYPFCFPPFSASCPLHSPP